MWNYIIRRILQSILVLIGATLVAFFVVRSTGDPVRMMLPEDATPEEVQAMQIRMGLDKPIIIQYYDFVKRAAIGDFGTSIRQKVGVTKLILERIPATLELTFAALFIGIIISFPVGIFAAIRHNSVWDLLATSFSLLGQAAPTFWTGLMLILVFGVKLQILPISGRDSLAHLVLPAITLGFYVTGRITRMVRSGMLEVLGKEYIRTARAKGLLERTVVWGHSLRNASIPVVTLIGLEFASLLGGAIIIETVFAWPGIGRLVVNAVFQRDFPVIQGVVLISAVLFVVVNLIVDLLYSVLDPRISYS
ncbi:MAG TPA: ABC transporter permease [Anaerolineales bacterium]|nr:ABC transporter permease [Anaerolineales bacterium]